MSELTTLHILYFASLGETVNCQSENYQSDTSPLTVAGLRNSLANRGDNWQTLNQHQTIRCAVNQQIASEDTVIPDGAEVAFFPPVTGG